MVGSSEFKKELQDNYAQYQTLKTKKDLTADEKKIVERFNNTFRELKKTYGAYKDEATLLAEAYKELDIKITPTIAAKVYTQFEALKNHIDNVDIFAGFVTHLANPMSIVAKGLVNGVSKLLERLRSNIDSKQSAVTIERLTDVEKSLDMVNKDLLEDLKNKTDLQKSNETFEEVLNRTKKENEQVKKLVEAAVKTELEQSTIKEELESNKENTQRLEAMLNENTKQLEADQQYIDEQVINYETSAGIKIRISKSNAQTIRDEVAKFEADHKDNLDEFVKQGIKQKDRNVLLYRAKKNALLNYDHVTKYYKVTARVMNSLKVVLAVKNELTLDVEKTLANLLKVVSSLRIYSNRTELVKNSVLITQELDDIERDVERLTKDLEEKIKEINGLNVVVKSAKSASTGAKNATATRTLTTPLKSTYKKPTQVKVGDFILVMVEGGQFVVGRITKKETRRGSENDPIADLVEYVKIDYELLDGSGFKGFNTYVSPIKKLSQSEKDSIPPGYDSTVSTVNRKEYKITESVEGVQKINEEALAAQRKIVETEQEKSKIEEALKPLAKRKEELKQSLDDIKTGKEVDKDVQRNTFSRAKYVEDFVENGSMDELVRIANLYGIKVAATYEDDQGNQQTVATLKLIKPGQTKLKLVDVSLTYTRTVEQGVFSFIYSLLKPGTDIDVLLRGLVSVDLKDFVVEWPKKTDEDKYEILINIINKAGFSDLINADTIKQYGGIFEVIRLIDGIIAKGSKETPISLEDVNITLLREVVFSKLLDRTTGTFAYRLEQLNKRFVKINEEIKKLTSPAKDDTEKTTIEKQIVKEIILKTLKEVNQQLQYDKMFAFMKAYYFSLNPVVQDVNLFLSLDATRNLLPEKLNKDERLNIVEAADRLSTINSLFIEFLEGREDYKAQAALILSEQDENTDDTFRQQVVARIQKLEEKRQERVEEQTRKETVKANVQKDAKAEKTVARLIEDIPLDLLSNLLFDITIKEIESNKEPYSALINILSGKSAIFIKDITFKLIMSRFVESSDTDFNNLKTYYEILKKYGRRSEGHMYYLTKLAEELVR